MFEHFDEEERNQIEECASDAVLSYWLSDSLYECMVANNVLYEITDTDQAIEKVYEWVQDRLAAYPIDLSRFADDACEWAGVDEIVDSNRSAIPYDDEDGGGGHWDQASIGDDSAIHDLFERND